MHIFSRIFSESQTLTEHHVSKPCSRCKEYKGDTEPLMYLLLGKLGQL